MGQTDTCKMNGDCRLFRSQKEEVSWKKYIMLTMFLHIRLTCIWCYSKDLCYFYVCFYYVSFPLHPTSCPFFRTSKYLSVTVTSFFYCDRDEIRGDQMVANGVKILSGLWFVTLYEPRFLSRAGSGPHGTADRCLLTAPEVYGKFKNFPESLWKSLKLKYPYHLIVKHL